MSLSLIYIPCSNCSEATTIARTLLEERLIACANILDGVTSIYRYEGEVQEATEAVLILKSKTDLYEKIEARVSDLHSYDCPCIIQLDTEQAHAPFLEWVNQNTTS